MYRSDTTVEVQKIYDQKIKKLSDEERFLRGLSLTHFSRQLCMAGIRDEHPDWTDNEAKIEFFERIYGAHFSQKEKAKIHNFIKLY